MKRYLVVKKISTEIRLALDEATEKWGVRIERVEVVDINPPKDVQASMGKTNESRA